MAGYKEAAMDEARVHAELFDIPNSISHAQGTLSHPYQCRIFSTAPQQEPFASNEPKLERARLKLEYQNGAPELQALYSKLAKVGLETVRQSHRPPYCFPRAITPHQKGVKRTATDAELDIDASERGIPIDKGRQPLLPGYEVVCRLLQKLSSGNGQLITAGNILWSKIVDAYDPSSEDSQPRIDAPPQPFDPYISNKRSAPVTVLIGDKEILKTDPSRGTAFRIPPNSCCYLGHIPSNDIWGNVPMPIANHQLKLVLMDPPWPNRSVLRSSSYRTNKYLDALVEGLRNIEISRILTDDAWVAVWITNKPAVREAVLGEEGLFHSWGVQLKQEWIWLKITEQGEPVTDIDGLWRKPYEVLLLGQLQPNTWSGDQAAVEDVVRRVFAAVPDLHSRKPCFREQFRELIFGMGRKRLEAGVDWPEDETCWALEMYARYCVSGWFSWGNEALLYNYYGWWEKNEEAASVHIVAGNG